MKTFFLGANAQSYKGSKVQNATRTKSIFFILFSLFYSLFTFGQEQDSTQVNQLDNVLVSAVRVTAKTPVTFSNMDKKEIKFRTLGQDIPV